VIAETIPGAYDAFGRQVTSSYFHRKAPHAAFPIGRYLSQPLTVKCDSVADVRRLLATCKAVSAQDLFGKRDYWQPPEEFERLKKGGCVDFSLWTWRQLVALGYDARFVGGTSGRYGIGHAWVEYFENGKCFLVEPQLRTVGDRMPRLTTVRYEPKLSIALEGGKVRYYAHKQLSFHPAWCFLIPLVLDWLVFWGMVLAQGDPATTEDPNAALVESEVTAIGTYRQP
jgi:hypothetical protein